jgi:hypothetical protein
MAGVAAKRYCAANAGWIADRTNVTTKGANSHAVTSAAFQISIGGALTETNASLASRETGGKLSNSPIAGSRGATGPKTIRRRGPACLGMLPEPEWCQVYVCVCLVGAQGFDLT